MEKMQRLRMANKNVFKPAIALMNRLKYPQKFALISSLFAMPLILVMYLLISEIHGGIDFAQQEIYGNVYLRPLQQLWEQTLRRRALKLGDRDRESQVEAQIALSLQKLETADQKLGQTLKTTAKLSNLKQALGTPNANSQIIYQIEKLRAHVGDTSNLILDPDLDTYYLMDSSLLKLPTMQKIVAEVQLVSLGVIDRRRITSEERGRLVELSGLLKELSNDLSRNMGVGFSNNPVQNLQGKLAEPLAEFLEDTNQLTEVIDGLIDPNIELSPSTYTLAEINLAKSFSFWDRVADELDSLLKKRIDGFARRQQFIATFVFVILLLVTYLFIAFYLAVMETVHSLDDAAKRMTSNSSIDELAAVTLNTQDELGDVVQSFNSIAQALVSASLEITLLNERLKAENLRMGAELAITRRLQKMILPKDEELQNIEGLDIAGFMEPAAEVGGDYYDVLQHEGKVKIGIGDVTGHGLESGVVMIMVQTAVRTLLANNETNPIKFLDALNLAIYGNTRRMESFKNMSLALLDYEAGTIRLSGQHEEMIVVRHNGEIELFDTLDLGFPLGLELDITPFVAR
jgi:methyl-accepting chemotaxis protein